MTKKAEKLEEMEPTDFIVVEKPRELPRYASMSYDQRIALLEQEVAQLQRLVAQLLEKK